MTRVAVVRLSAMGDVVHGVAAVQALRAARPELDVLWVVQRSFAPLLDGVVDVLRHDRRGGVPAYLRTLAVLRRFRPDVVLDLQGNWKSAGFVRGSGAARRIGPAAQLRRERGSAIACNETIVLRPGEPAHPARIAAELVRRLAPEVEPRAPQLAATAAELDAEAAALAALGIDPSLPFRLLVSSRPDDPRGWPAAAIEREARADGPVPLLVAGPDERDVAAPAGLTVMRHAPGELRRLVGLGVLCARSGGCAIGPDKGAMHVLAACGARTLTLFGPTDAVRTGPTAGACLRATGGPDCAPCGRRRCRNPIGPVCMDFTPAEAAVPTPGVAKQGAQCSAPRAASAPATQA
ncbi:MAG: glycosyltransferase family 9 protein [Planctomycetes bacterium]|nr:glycosyltransferase family 9 protein [Planctomycetota bacterium]